MWIVVVCAVQLPIIAALVLNSNSTVFLVSVILASSSLAAAAFLWALRRTRAQQREFEHRLAGWAADRAITEERLRIARDLHDLSSHGLGVITVRSASTHYLAGPDADVERQRALRDIERTARATTTELRRMLTVLRGSGDDAPLHPADTVAALPDIIEDAEHNGLLIASAIDEGGEDAGLRTLSPGLQLTLCAIVREALTNVLRHAGPTTVRLVIARHPTSVSIEVDDDGRHPGWQPEPGAGHGLTGLRERVRAHGGSLTASPAPPGFRVRARLPTGDDA